MTWPGVVFWILILAGAFSRGPFLLYLFIAASAFGTLQLIPGELVGGVNLVPHSICAVFLVGKILLQKGNPARAFAAALDMRKFGYLFLFLAYGLFAAYVMPRLFYHIVEVVPITITQPGPVALEPTTANFTQSAYMTLSVCMALAISLVGARPEFLRHYLRALLVAGAIVIATGLLDLATSRLGLTDLLEPFRNATYALLTEVEIAGAKRVVGLMTEASAYGALCVSTLAALAFLRPCYAPYLRDRVVPALMASLILMALLSTSSAGYAGLGIFSLVFAFNWFRRALRGDATARAGLKLEASVALAAALAFLVAVVVFPQLLEPFNTLLDEIVFQKSQSESYADRHMMSDTGMLAFFGTYGLGVGLGGARVSNWYISILSNTGLLGAFLLGIFMLQCFLAHPPERDAWTAEMMRGLKLSLIPGLVMAGLVATTPDIGVGAGAVYGMLLALASKTQQASNISTQQLKRLPAV